MVKFIESQNFQVLKTIFKNEFTQIFIFLKFILIKLNFLIFILEFEL